VKLFLAIEVKDEEAARASLRRLRATVPVKPTDRYCIGETMVRGFAPIGEDFEPTSEAIMVSTGSSVPEPSILICSFCAKEPRAVDLVIGPGVSVCSECIEVAAHGLAEQRTPVCHVCKLNWVDAASGEDACSGCAGDG
jgi:hypothetical protein